MRIDNKSPPIQQSQIVKPSQNTTNSKAKRIKGTHTEKVSISPEAREALLKSTIDVNSATHLIEKVSSHYPDKDVKLKINNIEIGATDPGLSTKLSGIIGKFISKLIK